MRLTTAFALLALFCSGQAAAGSPRTLSPSAAAALQGKSSILITHRPRDLNLFGMNFLASKEDISTLQAMLADSWIVDGESADGFYSDGYYLAGSSIPDPAPELGVKIQNALREHFALEPQPMAPLVLPATLFKRLVPKSDVNSILSHNTTSDILLDVETYGWQAYRLNIFSDMWFAYIVKLTMVDTQRKVIIMESTCAFVDRHAWTKKPFLVGFLSNEKAPLLAVLDRSADHCFNEFMVRSLGIGKTTSQTVPVSKP